MTSGRQSNRGRGAVMIKRETQHHNSAALLDIPSLGRQILGADAAVKVELLHQPALANILRREEHRYPRERARAAGRVRAASAGSSERREQRVQGAARAASMQAAGSLQAAGRRESRQAAGYMQAARSKQQGAGSREHMHTRSASPQV